MSESRFTPGPWTNEDLNHGAFYHVNGNHYFSLKNRDTGEQAGLANACLIAAAPDMYAALKEFIGSLYFERNTEASKHKALAAIAKAGGDIKYPLTRF